MSSSTDCPLSPGARGRLKRASRALTLGTVRIPRLPAELPTTQPRWVGQRVQRLEDPILLTGRAEFTDDLTFSGMLHCAFVRSPYAHARIKAIDAREAERFPGVAALVTGLDAARETDPPPGAPPGFTTHCLAVDKVRFAGEPVAAVAASNRYLAEDAADLINVEYEPLPPVLDASSAMDRGAPLLYEERGTNVVYRRTFTFGEVEKAFAEADLVVRHRYRHPRVSANPIETSGLIARWDPFTRELTAWGAFQSPLARRPGLAAMLRIPTNKIRLMPQPYGGSFGSKNEFVRDLCSVALLSKKARGRPVKWIEDRLEHLRAARSDAWERLYEGELAFTRDGRATALRVRCVDDFGATAEFCGMAVKPLAQLTGCYQIAACEYDIAVVATNKNPQGAYRGYGPPPNTVLLERLMDKAAQALGMDPAELRQRNFIPPEQFPYVIPTGNCYDSGNYQACLEAALEMCRYQERRRAQEGARQQGRIVGIGVVSAIEVGVPDPQGTFFTTLTGMQGMLASPEGAVVRIDPAGKITAEVGFAWGGQGQHTFVAQILADYFGTSPSEVTVTTVDTQSAPPGIGPIASRQAVALSGAVLGAAERVRQKLVKVAAALLETNESDVELRDGKLGIRGAPDRALPLAQVAAATVYRADLAPPGVDGSPEASYVWNGPNVSPPDDQMRARWHLTATNSVHVAEVELDPGTGVVTILGYWLADDCGTRLNPAIVEGQTQGGVAQGIGIGLLEEYPYNDVGERLCATFMDYLLPTIYEVPATQKRALTTPSPFTPLGVKGCGEGAIHATPAAIYCAVNDALAQLGIEIAELPMSPARIWQVIQAARKRPGSEYNS